MRKQDLEVYLVGRYLSNNARKRRGIPMQRHGGRRRAAYRLYICTGR